MGDPTLWPKSNTDVGGKLSNSQWSTRSLHRHLDNCYPSFFQQNFNAFYKPIQIGTCIRRCWKTSAARPSSAQSCLAKSWLKKVQSVGMPAAVQPEQVLGPDQYQEPECHFLFLACSRRYWQPSATRLFESSFLIWSPLALSPKCCSEAFETEEK